MSKEKIENPEIKIIDGKRHRKVPSGYTVRQWFSHDTTEKGPGPGWDFFESQRLELANKYGIKDVWKFSPKDLPDEPYFEWEPIE